jgi:hypothetical protein
MDMFLRNHYLIYQMLQTQRLLMSILSMPNEFVNVGDRQEMLLLPFFPGNSPN